MNLFRLGASYLIVQVGLVVQFYEMNKINFLKIKLGEGSVLTGLVRHVYYSNGDNLRLEVKLKGKAISQMNMR